MKLAWPESPTDHNLDQKNISIRDLPDFWQGGRCLSVYMACDYRQPVNHALLQLKFHGCTGLSEPLAALGYQAVKRSGEFFDAILAVPLHKNRLKERGYNQAQLISELIAARLACPDISNLLVRNRSTGRQSEQISRSGRFANLNDAFELKANGLDAQKINRMLYGRKILLIDDVMTTGATLQAAALPLVRAGARVSALVIASDYQEKSY